MHLLGAFPAQNTPRTYRERQLTMGQLTDKELRMRYRFGRDGINAITDIIRQDIQHPTGRCKALSPEMQVHSYVDTGITP